MQEKLQEANNQLAQYRNQPPPVPDRKSPLPSARSEDSPVQTRPARLVQTSEIILPEYCPNLVERLKNNPKYLTKYRDEAKKQFVEELEEYENLGISEVKKSITKEGISIFSLRMILVLLIWIFELKWKVFYKQDVIFKM